jgi:hypothetical protein
MGGITRLNQLPDGSGILSDDDIFLMMDDPSGAAVTKKVSLAALSSMISQDSMSPNVQTINSASGTINTDVSSYNVFNISLADSGILAAPSNSSDGQRSLWRVKRTDGQVLTLHNNFRIINSGTIDNSAHTTTFIDGIYDSDANRWDSILYSNLPAIAPSAPSGLTGTPGNSLVNLSWSAPDDGGESITDYIIQYSSNSGVSWNTFNDGIGTSTSVSVSGLINDTSYIFRVAAQNIVDIGTYSDPTSGITPVAISITLFLTMDASPFVDSIDGDRTINSTSIAVLDTVNTRVGAGSLSVDQNGHLYTTDTDDIDLSGDFTISLSIKPTGTPSVGYGFPFVTTTLGDGGTNGLFLAWNLASSGQLVVGQVNTSNIATSADGVAPQDEWTDIVVTRSGSTIKIFTNNNPVATGTSSFAFQCGRLNIGEGDNVGVGAGFIGNIDEFKIISGFAIEP